MSSRRRGRKTLGEDELISEIVKIARREGVLSGPGVELGIGHDCAVLALEKGEELAWHVDDQVEGVHFRLSWARPEDVGAKAAGAALSDLAAAGARPLGAQLALELPREVDDRSVLALVRGFARALARARVPLVGGNVAARPRGSGLSLSVSVAGAVRAGRTFRRDRAHEGDWLYLSGTPGIAGAGLLVLESRKRPRAGAAARAVSRFLRPEPRLALGLELARLSGTARPHAVTDTSDGLARDALKLARASGLHALVFEHALGSRELEAAARSLEGADLVRVALHGGEDYELLVAAGPAFERSRPGRSFRKIGLLERGEPGLSLLRPDGTRAPVRSHGFLHRGAE